MFFSNKKSTLVSANIASFSAEYAQDQAIRLAHDKSNQSVNFNVCQSLLNENEFMVFSDFEWQKKQNLGLFKIVYSVASGYVFHKLPELEIQIKATDVQRDAVVNLRSRVASAEKSQEYDTGELRLLSVQ